MVSTSRSKTARLVNNDKNDLREWPTNKRTPRFLNSLICLIAFLPTHKSVLINLDHKIVLGERKLEYQDGASSRNQHSIEQEERSSRVLLIHLHHLSNQHSNKVLLQRQRHEKYQH